MNAKQIQAANQLAAAFLTESIETALKAGAYGIDGARKAITSMDRAVEVLKQEVAEPTPVNVVDNTHVNY